MRQLIVDSSCELNDGMITSMDVSVVPFKITMGAQDYIDDENIDMANFLDNMGKTTDVIRTSCPSPDEYYRCMKGDEVFILTITSQLSGSYQSAMIAKQMYVEKNPSAKVHIFDSCSATSGETGIALIIEELSSKGKNFEEIVEETEKLRDKSITLIALSSLTNLARNGRIPKIAGKISRILNIKLIARNKDGRITPLSIERGVKRTINSLVKKCKELGDMSMEYAIVISQANAVDAANLVKEKLTEIFPNRSIQITEMRGLSSTYAEEGGVVVFL